MKQFLTRKEKGFWCSAATIVLLAVGMVFFRMLAAVSFETTERPVLVLLSAFAAILFSLIASYKDYAKIPSILGYAAATVAFFTLLEGRTSYLAFYFSGDVMHTGLSPYMIGAFVCFLLAMLAALFAVIFEEDKGGSPKLAASDCKVLLPMVCVVAILALVVCLNAGDTRVEPATADLSEQTAQTAQNDAASAAAVSAQTETAPEARYRTPKTAEEVWQGYSAADYAKESTADKPIAYQLTGHGEVDAGGPAPMDALINLYEDGEAVVDVFGRNSGYRYWGYWTNENDENLWFCVMYYTVFGQDQICKIDYSYSLIGQFDEFSLNIALGLADGGQFVRSIPAGGDGSVQHPSVKEWYASFGYEMPEVTWSEPAVPTVEEMPTASEVEPAASAEPALLFPFTADAESFKLDLYSDGSYVFQFTTMNISESGTWTWKDWTLTLTTPNGRTATAAIDGETHALNIQFIPDASEQLVRDYTAEASVWGTAFGGQGDYTPEKP